MKKIKCVLTLLILLTISLQSFAQTPQKFNYQAVCRDNLGNIIAGQTVLLRLTIHDLLPGGTVLYKETHSASTNNFGLVTIAVGGGTVDTGTFSNIPWGAGDKYLEVELDAGSGFNSAGTTQLLSVPYALYAENANVPGITGATGPQGPTGNDGAIGVTGPQGPTGGAVHFIGESYGGGIIFWLDVSGQHGLIAATADQSIGIVWYNGSYTTTGATLNAIYAGKANTDRIISSQGAGNYAAIICANYSVIVNNEYYDDWYLPSKYELNLMFLNIGPGNLLGLGNVGGFNSFSYWSSTEVNNNVAWAQDFLGAGNQFNSSKNFLNYVRAVRAF